MSSRNEGKLHTISSKVLFPIFVLSLGCFVVIGVTSGWPGAWMSMILVMPVVALAVLGRWKALSGLLGFVAALILAWQQWGPRVIVEVANVGHNALNRVVVKVTGNEYELASLEPGASVSTRVVATGDSHVEVIWTTWDGVTRTHAVGCYFGPGPHYDGRAVVELDGDRVVRSKAEIDGWP